MYRRRLRARLRRMAAAKTYADMTRAELEAAADKAGFPAFSSTWKTATLVRKLEALKSENEHV